jgi:hypothetical protein
MLNAISNAFGLLFWYEKEAPLLSSITEVVGWEFSFYTYEKFLERPAIESISKMQTLFE